MQVFYGRTGISPLCCTVFWPRGLGGLTLPSGGQGFLHQMIAPTAKDSGRRATCAADRKAAAQAGMHQVPLMGQGQAGKLFDHRDRRRLIKDAPFTAQDPQAA